MSIVDVIELIDYWNDHPPAHDVLRAIVKGLSGTGASPTRGKNHRNAMPPKPAPNNGDTPAEQADNRKLLMGALAAFPGRRGKLPGYVRTLPT